MIVAVVTVIVATRNRARLLRRCLEALSRQEPVAGGMETVVVDDASSDDTGSVCAGMSDSMSIRCLRMPRHSGIGAAQNTAVMVANGRLLLFTDDDCIAPPDWAVRMCGALERSDVVGGSVVPAPCGYLTLCHQMSVFLGFTPSRREGRTFMVAGANMGWRRNVLESIGGFREGLIPAPDMDAALRACRDGWRVRLDRSIHVIHDAPPQELAGMFRYSASHAGETIRLRIRHADMLGTPRVLRSPFLLIVLAPLIALWVTARGCARGDIPLKALHTLPVVFMLKMAWCFGAAKGLCVMRGEGHETPHGARG